MCQPSEIWYKKIFSACGKINKNVSCVIKPEYVRKTTFSVLVFWVFFNLMSHLFILQVTSLNLVKQVNLLENARNVFWQTSCEYRLLPTEVTRLRSQERDLDMFPNN